MLNVSKHRENELFGARLLSVVCYCACSSEVGSESTLIARVVLLAPRSCRVTTLPRSHQGEVLVRLEDVGQSVSPCNT
jgi:hypothetical protein